VTDDTYNCAVGDMIVSDFGKTDLESAKTRRKVWWWWIGRHGRAVHRAGAGGGQNQQGTGRGKSRPPWKRITTKSGPVFLSLNVASPILGRIYIWGQGAIIKAPGHRRQRKPDGGQGYLRAGGFAILRTSERSRWCAARRTPGASPRRFELDMQQILENGKVDKDIVLQPNDLIIVPSRLVNF